MENEASCSREGKVFSGSQILICPYLTGAVHRVGTRLLEKSNSRLPLSNQQRLPSVPFQPE
jgi:hypothetical protein